MGFTNEEKPMCRKWHGGVIGDFNMAIQLSEHFSYRKLLVFTFPSIAMLVFMSIYGVVDGFFVSNFVGKTSFVAINLILPVLMGLATFGAMFGTGGAALVSKTLGEGDRQRANEIFSMIIYITAITGIVLATIGQIFIKQISIKLGADGQTLTYCILYGRIFLLFIPIYNLQFAFQNMFVVAEKPNYGFVITVMAGVTNIVLDAIFIIIFGWGVLGAALATVISQTVGGVIPIFYFARKNNGLIRLVKPTFKIKEIVKVCANGSSEMVTNFSLSVVSILYNFQMLRYIGEDGVAIYGLIMYVNFIFNGIYMGYAIGSAPIISYHDGAKNDLEVKNILRKSLVLTAVSGVVMTVFAMVASRPLAQLYFGYDANLCKMTMDAFKLYALSFLLSGFNVFGSAYFTALGNGLVSATISFLRTFVFQVLIVLLLPLVFGVDGLWLSITVAECLTLVVTVVFLARDRRWKI